MLAKRKGRNKILVSKEDYIFFMNNLLNPKPPNEKLIKAFNEYHRKKHEST